MKNAFCFILKALLRYLNFCPDFFGVIGKGLDKKAKVNFNIYDIINWENHNTYIVQYLKK